MKTNVVDTNILMSLETLEGLINHCGGLIVVPVYVIEELDNLKKAEGDRGFNARRALRNLEKAKENVSFYIPEREEVWYVPDAWDKNKVDNKLINYVYGLSICGDQVNLLSNDLNVRIKCDSLGIPTERYFEVAKVNAGWIEVNLSLKQFVDFEEGRRNKWNVPEGQYLIIRDEEGHKIRGIYKYFGDREWDVVLPENLGSIYLDTTTPKDAYQQCAINSLVNDDFTIITGKAGTGKTLLSLSYCLREIVSGRRDKLIIFANPVKSRGSEQLGFYKGDRTDKLLQNSIGAMLSSKLGDTMLIEQLIQDGLVEILPVSDIRGFEVGKKQIMYITEAQNLNVELAKLAIQRCAEGSKIILEGDPETQVDHYSFEGANNGLRRAITTFEGYLGFSHVQLPIIYRSVIADRAELM